jgi:hypothetical protein
MGRRGQRASGEACSAGANHPAVRRAPAGAGDCQVVGVSRPMVWRWQRRFAEEGIEGLLRDKTRPPGIPPVPQAKVHAVVERTLREPPGAVTHWTGRAMAKAMGLSLRTIQRIWAAHSSSRTGSGPSSDPTIPTSPPSLMMSLVST